MKTPEEQQKAIIDALNGAFARDPDAIRALLCIRMPCNKALLNDPFVQVNTVPMISEESCDVGMLGVINGILAAANLPLVASKWKDGKMLGFTIYVPANEIKKDADHEALDHNGD